MNCDGNESKDTKVAGLSPRYVFRGNIKPLAYHVFRSDEITGLIHESCAQDMWDREFPLYADDLEREKCLEPVYCEICDGLILEACDERTLMERAHEVACETESIGPQRRSHSRLD